MSKNVVSDVATMSRKVIRGVLSAQFAVSILAIFAAGGLLALMKTGRMGGFGVKIGQTVNSGFSDS